jgi:hypothetical protein
VDATENRLSGKGKKWGCDLLSSGKKRKEGRDRFLFFRNRQKADGTSFYLFPKDEIPWR